MPQIKFSHDYNKLKTMDIGYYPDTLIPCLNEEAFLIGVFPVKLEELHKDFISYDTDDGKYKLPKKGNYLMLLFKKDKYNCFTTLRRETPQKLEYYRSLIGQRFDIVISSEV